MAVWRGGFLKKCHQIAVALRVSNGGRHRLNGGGGYGGRNFFFLKIFPKWDWVVLGWPDPTLNPVFKSKWDEQHAAHELPNSSASTTRTPARARARAAPSTQHPASTSDDGTTHQREVSPEVNDGTTHHAREQRTATVTVTAAATTTDCGGIRFCFFWFSFFFAPGSVFFSVWHSLLIFGSVFFFFFLFSPLLLIKTKRIMLGLEKMIRASTFTLQFALSFYPFCYFELVNEFIWCWLLCELMKLF